MTPTSWAPSVLYLAVFAAVDGVIAAMAVAAGRTSTAIGALALAAMAAATATARQRRLNGHSRPTLQQRARQRQLTIMGTGFCAVGAFGLVDGILGIVGEDHSSGTTIFLGVLFGVLAIPVGLVTIAARFYVGPDGNPTGWARSKRR